MPTIDIDRDAAREAAQHELAKPIYPRPSPKQQFVEFIEELLRRLTIEAASVPGGWFTISLLLIAVAVAVLAAIRIARRALRSRRDQPLFGPAELNAAEHRATAERCAASGDWAGAIRHRLRAVARELEDARVLSAVPGRTANELARDAGTALPELATEFLSSASVFNDVSYGELPATADDYHGIAELDDRLRAAAHQPRSR